MKWYQTKQDFLGVGGTIALTLGTFWALFLVASASATQNSGTQNTGTQNSTIQKSAAHNSQIEATARLAKPIANSLWQFSANHPEQTSSSSFQPNSMQASAAQASSPAKRDVDSPQASLGKPIQLGLSAMAQVQQGQSLSLPMVSGVALEAVVSQITSHQSGSRTIVAKHRQHSQEYPVVITTGKNHSFARIVTADGVWVMRAKGALGRLIPESVLSRGLDWQAHDMQLPRLTSPNTAVGDNDSLFNTEGVSALDVVSDDGISLSAAQQQLRSIGLLKGLNTQSTAQEQTNASARKNFSLDVLPSSSRFLQRQTSSENLKVLVLYTQAASALYGGDVDTRVQHLFAVTNQIMSDSQVNMQVQSSQLQAVDYVVQSQATALDDMTANRITGVSISDQRFVAAADLVVLLHPFVEGDNSLGIAWLSDPRDLSRAKQLSYSVTAIDGPDFVMAHEFGHNLGLSHSRVQDGAGFLFPHGLGHGVTDNFVTVMAYASAYSNSATAQSIYRFSNPELTCNNLPCGVEVGQDNSANASLVLNTVATDAAFLYADNPDLTLLSDAQVSVANSALRDCVAGLAGTYAAEASSLSCRFANVTSLEGIQAFSSLDLLDLRGNPLPDLAPLSGLTRMEAMDVSLGVTQDFSELQNMNRLQVLFAEQMQASSLTGLSNMTGMTYLRLLNNQFSDINPLQGMTDMSLLYLDGNQISDISPLQDMSALQLLSLTDNDVTDLTPIFSMVGQSGQLFLSGNDNAICWQLDYLQTWGGFTSFSRPTTCNNSERILDFDNDGLSNEAEITLGSNPTVADTDGDGLTDYQESTRYASSPSNADSDGDGISDGSDPDVTQLTLSNPNSDFNGDGKSDVLYRDTESLNWRLDLLSGGTTLRSQSVAGLTTCCGWLFNGIGDFDADGSSDILIRNVSSGRWFIYNIDDGAVVNRGYVAIADATEFAVQAVADFNQDGYSDILIRNQNTGEWQINLVQDRQVLAVLEPPMSRVLGWRLVDVADFDGNGSPDILIRNVSSGAWYMYLYQGTDIINRGYITSLNSDIAEQVQTVGDFTGDGNADILLRHEQTGAWTLQPMLGMVPQAIQNVGLSQDSLWQFSSRADYDGDGYADVILRQDETGELHQYLLQGSSIKGQQSLATTITDQLRAVSLN